MWHDWFRKRFADNTSYAELVRNVVSATSREGLSVREWMKREEMLIHRSRESFDAEYASVRRWIFIGAEWGRTVTPH